MDHRYIMYANPKEKFYCPPEERTKKSTYKMPKLKTGWSTQLDEFSHWRYFICKSNTLPEQGWKIHVSAPIYAAQKILDICAPVLIEKLVDFKYVDNEWELFLKNSKYGDRGGAGKFITVYPKTDEEFEELIYALDDALKGTPNGPYILSDKCWKDSNVFFRYGGIRALYMDKGGSRVLAIKNINGEYIEDSREPYYKLPDFVEEPEFIRKMDEEQNTISEESNLDNYDITAALHFSNGGGVYSANRKRDGKKVVLKEGRPEAGLDGAFLDAHSRIYHEAEVLDKLNDLSTVVDYYGIFREWKHIFLEEEHLDGVTLNRWITVRYPYYKDAKLKKDYAKNACIILRNAVNALEAIHNRNIGFGDLQPMNIMVNQEDYSVKFIDLEAAGVLKSRHLPTLVTPGFSTSKAKNRLQGDWFAMARIARYAFLPIGPVQDIDEGIMKKHDFWIEKNFGADAVNLIHEIQSKVDKYLKVKRTTEKNYGGTSEIEGGLSNLVHKIRAGIEENLQLKDILIGGDIRQYEEKGGKFNVKTGGFGVVMALHRTGGLLKTAEEWAQKYSCDEYLQEVDNGLYSGKAGIACVLYEIGQEERALQMFDAIEVPENTNDISLMSGLAGMGLAFQSLYKVEKSEKVRNKIQLIAEYLQEKVNSDFVLKVGDPDAIPVGFFNGWSGAALFFLEQYRMENDKKWLDLSIKALQKDVDRCIFDDDGLYHVDDDKRYFPYLADGSLGIGMVILEIKKHVEDSYLQKEIAGIKLQNKTRCCYNGGLFYGYAGFLAYGNSHSLYENTEFRDEKAMLESLNLFLIEEEDKIYCPGNYSYKMSGDIFSGSAGVLVTISDMLERKNFGWLPIINRDI